MSRHGRLKKTSLPSPLMLAALAVLTVVIIANLPGGAEKEAQHAGDTVTLTGGVPTVDLSSFRPAAPAALLKMRIYFGLRNKKELDDYLAAIQDPKSPLYNHSISSEEFHKRYEVLWNDYFAVENWLQSSGFTITRADYWNNYIAFTGTVAQAERTFDVQIVAKGDKYSNTNNPSIPTEFQGIIAVVMLDNIGEAGPGTLQVSIGKRL